MSSYEYIHQNYIAMDIRLESNIGLDIMQIDCVQNLLFKLNYTYPKAPLLHIKCTPAGENSAETSISLMLFDKEGTERVWGQDRDVHVLLTRLLNKLINMKTLTTVKDLPPIREIQPAFQNVG